MSGLGLKLALLLHPAAYRREHGEELASVFADTTADAGRWTAAREAVDLAGHGMRLRIGLGSDRLPAQLAAQAAPFAVVAAMAGGLASEADFWVKSQQRGELSIALRMYFGTFNLNVLFHEGGLLLSLVAAVAAVFGRWTTARLSGLVGLLLTLTNVVMMLPESPTWAEGQWARLVARETVLYGPQVLWVLILLAAPRDLLGPATRRRTWSALAGAVVGGVLLNSALGVGPWLALDNEPNSVVLALVLGATELALLAVAVPALLRGRYGPAAAALAGSPIVLLMLFSVICHLWNTGGRSTAVAVFGVAVVLAVVLSRWRPTIPDRRPPTVG
ncbi:hypothetical protein [Kitasatospora kifunensis]|uniref:Uncharacterized protein n=1 Tax=Kitasatospora kifunensis TaxID=58351 RepID=A0A7W7VWV5_KITKI|nr:hypothetical protein [Kitasatospora kifunensis]MBB4925902.1 hypothetical protein [Kitasatospora kifunensis]